MREGLLRSARLALIILMIAYLPVLAAVTWFAVFMRQTADALEIEVVMASAERKTRAAARRRKPR